jgi:hypothetical protein
MVSDAQLKALRREHLDRHGQPNQLNMGDWYTTDELEFARTIDRYKRVNYRPFPEWSEILLVIGLLGYRKAEASANAAYARKLEERQRRRRAQRGGR